MINYARGGWTCALVLQGATSVLQGDVLPSHAEAEARGCTQSSRHMTHSHTRRLTAPGAVLRTLSGDASHPSSRPPPPGGRYHWHILWTEGEPGPSPGRCHSGWGGQGRAAGPSRQAGQGTPRRTSPLPPQRARLPADLLEGPRARHPGQTHVVARLPAQNLELLPVYFHLEWVGVRPRPAAPRARRGRRGLPARGRPGFPHGYTRRTSGCGLGGGGGAVPVSSVDTCGPATGDSRPHLAITEPARSRNVG